MASLTERLYARTTQGKKEDEEERKVKVGIVTNKGSNTKETEKSSGSSKKDTSKTETKSGSKSSLTEKLYARTTEGMAGGNPASPGIVSSQKDNTRRRFADIYGELTAAEERVKSYQSEIDSWASQYGATSENIMDTLATKYGAQKDESGSYIFSEQSSLDEFNRLMEELSGMYNQYNTGITSYNDLFNQANTYDRESANAELDKLKARLDEAKKEANRASSAFRTGTELGASGKEYDFLKQDYEDKQAKYNELQEQVVALNQDIKNAEFFQNNVFYSDYLSKDGIENYTGEVKHKQSEYMTEDERRIYNYIYAQEGAQAAQEYMDHLKESLNYREGTEKGKEIRGIESDVGRFLATGAHGVQSGLENFGRGIGQLFTKEQLATSPTQYASSYIMNDLHENGTSFFGMDKTWGELGYEGASVISNMAPSILVSALLGPAGLGASAAVAGAVGSATMGLSAGGNAYTQALSEGYTEDMARTYGTMVGASEGALQYLLGGINKLGGAGNLSNKALAKVASIENGLLRASAAAGVKATGEIAEEELQNFLEPLYRTVIFGEEYTAPEIEDIVYTAVLTFLTTGVIEGGDIANYASNKPAVYGKELKAAGSEALQGLVESGLESAADTESRALAENIAAKQAAGKEVNDWEVGRLQQANEAAIRAEATETTSETIEDAASEVVTRENKSAQAATDGARMTAESVPHNVIAADNPVRRSVVASKESRVNAVLRQANYGKNGTATFNSIVETNTNADPVELMVRFDTPYQAGLTGLPMKQASLANDFQIEAYNAGRLDYIANTAKDEKKGPGVVLGEAESGFDHTGAPSDIPQEYQDFSDWFNKKLGVKGGWDGKNGKADYNALYDKKTGVVAFAQDFGINPKLMKKLGSMDFMEKVDKLASTRDESFIFYIGHEVAEHVAMDRAPKTMRAFTNAMYNYRQSQSPDENLARSKQAFYSSRGVDLDTDAAMEEVSGDSILMLYDGDAKKFMDAMHRVYDSLDADAKKGAQTFREILNEVIEKLKKWVRKLTGKENAEARANAQKGITELEQLRDMFEQAIGESMKAVKEARTTKRDGKLFRTTDSDGTVILETSVGNPVAMMTEDGSAQFSLKTYEQFGRAELKRWLTLKESKGQITKEESADIVKQLDEYYDLCQNFLDKYAPFGAWSNAEVVRDNKGKPVFSVVKANGEYAMNLDFSLVCKKRRTLDAVFKEMINRGIMDDLSLEEADIAKVNDIIRSNGFETACALCFVDSKRYRQAKVADTFVNQYNEIVRQLIPAGGDVRAHHFDFVGSGVYKDSGKGLHTLTDAELQEGLAKLRQIMKENGKQTVAHKIAKHLLAVPRDRKLMSRSDFMNTDGFGAVKLKNPAVLKLYNSSKGAGGPKAAFSDVQYLGEILQKNNFTPARAYAVGGVRIQSFSDYIPRLVFDYLQMVADLSAKKLPAHAYTKEAIFVKQFGMTGIKMNMSLVPAVAEDGVAPGLDKNGDYFWFDGQSFGSDVKIKGSGKTGFELAIQIQNAPGYSQHCGTIAVGVSNEHILKMLGDENIRMVIPYHKSSLNHIVAVMNNIDKYTDYTPVQNTRNADGKKITGKDFNFNEALRRTGDAKTAANEYLAWCKEHNYIPKFDAFAWHENYYKVLEDFSTYDNGVAAPQGAVTMTLPGEGDAFGSMAQLIEEGLEEDAILEADREKSVPKIVDQVEKALEKKNTATKDGVKYSIKLGGFADIDVDVQTEVDFFGIKSLNDYVGVQKTVYNKLLQTGFFDAVTKRRTVENADTGIVVEIGRDGIYETFGPDMRYARLPADLKRLKIATVRHLPDIVRYGEVVEGDATNVHNPKSSVTYTYIEHPITVDGKTLYVVADIRQSPEKNKFWVHHIHVSTKKVQVLAANADEAASALNEDLAFGDNVAQVDEIVKMDSDYLDAVNRGDMNTVRRMVEDAAAAAGFADAIPEQTLAYKTRTSKAPKKTIKVYKVFTVTPDGKPTALFVSGTATLPQDVWLDAQDTWHFTAKNGKEYVPSTQNPYTDGGKTGGQVEIPNDEVRQELILRGFLPEGSKAKNITALAYRPGWHAGDLPFFPQGGMKREGSNYPNIHRYNQVVFECELDADYDYTEYARSQDKAKKKDGTVNDREADLQEMPTGGYYKYATNPLTKGGENGTWFISGSLKIGRALTQEECDRILAENGFLPQEWEQGTLDLASLGYTGQQHDAARKTLAPITYDDNGDIIPLSQRFNPDVDDVRYSLKGERAMREEIKRIRESGRNAGKSEADIEQDIMAAVGPEYGEMVKTYGEIKRGEKPTRDIKVPQRTEKNRHVSQTIRTVLEAEVTPDAAVPTIQQMITEGEFSYDRITDKAALAAAERTIRNKGFETAMADWLADVKKGVVSKANTAMGWSLYNAAATKGDFKTAMTILNGMVRHQRSAAQALQATRILKKLSPEAQLYGIQKTVDGINEDLQQRYGKKAGNRDVNDSDNVPVELWMQKTGELLAEQLGNAVKKKTRKEKTVCQRVLADLRKLAKETVTPASAPADTRTEMDAIYDMFNNREQYEKALAAAKETVAKEYGDKLEIMAALDKWMNTAFDYAAQFTKEFTGQTEIQIPAELVDKFLSQTDQEGRDEVAAEIYRYIGSQMPSRFIDKWNAWRYLAMLGNPRTHVRNIVGNLGFAPVVAAKNMTAGAIESAVSFVTGGKVERTKGIVNRKLLKAAWADYTNVADEVSAGGKYNDAAVMNQHIEDGRRIFKFKPLEVARKGNSAALEAEDIWFARPHYAFALAQYCKAHGVTADQLRRGKALGNARAYAIKEAQKATYKDANAFSEFISKLGRYHGDNKVAKAASLVVEGILPFRKTPANILVRGIEYSPVGLLKSLTYDLYKVKKGDITAAEAIDNISAGLTGTGLLAFGLWAAAEGLIRGAGAGEDEEKKYEELQGHQTYALELPDGTSITLDWLAPEVLPMFIGVNLYETATENKGESKLADMLNAVSNVTEPLLEMSCLQSLNDLFDNIGYATTGGLSALPKALVSAATSYLTQAFPTILGQFERSSQDVRMTTYTEKDSFLTSDLQYTLGKISAKLPGWDFQQIPYIDAWGRTESTGSTAENAANNFLNPAYMSQIETSAMEEELQRLYDATGEKGVLPDRAPKYFTVDKKRKDLTGEEYVEYATEKGQAAYDMLSKLTSLPEYEDMSDAEKVEAVEMVYDYTDAVAKMTVSAYEPTGWVARAIESEKRGGMDGMDYILYETALSMVDQPNKNGELGGTPTSAEKAAAINLRQDLSNADIANLWDTKDGYALYDAGADMRTYISKVAEGDNINAEKMVGAMSAGMSDEEYYGFLDALEAHDTPTESGKYGTFTQDEAKAAIASLPDLTREQRAYLWQSMNSSWKEKNNPWR